MSSLISEIPQATVLCVSCFTTHTEDETGSCNFCGAGLCGVNGCAGKCICVKAEYGDRDN